MVISLGTQSLDRPTAGGQSNLPPAHRGSFPADFRPGTAVVGRGLSWRELFGRGRTYPGVADVDGRGRTVENRSYKRRKQLGASGEDGPEQEDGLRNGSTSLNPTLGGGGGLEKHSPQVFRVPLPNIWR